MADNIKLVTKDYVDAIETEITDNQVGQKTADGGEIFNDYENNKATTSKSHAEGSSTIAGSRVLVVQSYNVTNKTFTVDDIPIYYDPVSGLPDLTFTLVGKTYSLSASGWANYESIGLVTAVDKTTKIITVDKIPADLTSTTLEGKTCYFRLCEYPTYGTTSFGEFAHAEGDSTYAEGKGAHSEGSSTIAAGKYSHAEGTKTFAGYAAHAEGKDTGASGNQAHAEGHNTFAIGDSAHAEGFSTTAKGDHSHAEGSQTSANASYAHAEGIKTIAGGQMSHAEGQESQANGANSHAEGHYTIANGDSAHSEGFMTTANGNQSHAGGYNTVAGYGYQTVVGKFNDNQSDSLFEVGNGTANESRSNAFVVFNDGHVEVAKTGTTDSSIIRNLDLTTRLNNYQRFVGLVDSSTFSVCNRRITNVVYPTTDSDAANKQYVDQNSHFKVADEGLLTASFAPKTALNQDILELAFKGKDPTVQGSTYQLIPVSGADAVKDTDFVTKQQMTSSIAASAITVDSEISDTSTNPVQNKVIKAYIDSSLEAVRLSAEESTEGNLYIKSLGVAPIAYSAVVTPDTPTSEEIVATYDGDNSAFTGEWGTSSTNLNMFVKAASLPSNVADITVTGQTVAGVKRDNQWLAWTTTVTEDMLDTSNSGAILINYQNQSVETQAITRAVIVKKAGTYTIQYDGFTDPAKFPSTGVYLLDDQANGGQNYTSSLTITVTTSSSGGDSGEVTTGTNADYIGNEIEVFTKGICIGDSITEGMVNYNTGSVVVKKYSYPTILKKLSNIELFNTGISGATSTQWYNASLDSSTMNGYWDTDGWSYSSGQTSIDYSGYDFAIIHLGINDAFRTDAVDTIISDFNTAINNIITKLKTANKGIKTFLCTIIPNYAVGGDNFTQVNNKIKEIAESTDNVYLIDLTQYSKCKQNTAYANTHLTAIGYSQMAKEIYAMISYCINQNLDKFKDVQFIGTDYTL